MPVQPKRGRSIRFTDAEWAELQRGAQAIGETRSEAIRAGSLSRVRQAIPDASDVTLAALRERAAEDAARGHPVGWHHDIEPEITPVRSWEINGNGFDAAKWRAEQTAVDDFDGTARSPGAAIDCSQPLVDASAPTHVFACAYCPAEFCTSFDAEAHIDNMHPGREES